MPATVTIVCVYRVNNLLSGWNSNQPRAFLLFLQPLSDTHLWLDI